jgi:hypothetical protein
MKMDTEYVSMVIGAIGAGLAVTTLLIVIYQTALMRRQTAVMDTQTNLATEQTALAREQTRLSQRQLEIVEKQEELLARRAVLALYLVELKREPDGGVVFQARVRNDGRRGTRDYFWHLLLPADLPTAKVWSPESGGTVTPTDETTIDGIKYRQYRDRVPGPTYPTRENALLNIMVPPLKTQKLSPIRWLLVSEDGVFPEDGKQGIVQLDATPR